MINYLQHHQIDKTRWNVCIARSVNRRVYAFSWYLDLVCPGWEALVEDDYSAVFPLTHRRKWGVSYLAQPFFAQQLGVFSPAGVTGTKISEFFGAIPGKFRFIEIQLNSMNRFDLARGEITQRVNYELDITKGYAALSGNYAQNTRRNLRKARESGLTVTRETKVDELIRLFRENFGRKEGKLNDANYATLKMLVDHCLDNHPGYLLSARARDGSLSAGAFFLFDRSCVYFLFAASAPEARDNGAMFLLIDTFIADNAGKGLLLDFEGGNDPNLGRFYKSFGAVEVYYPAIRVNRLSKVAERVLYFIRKLRK